MEIFEVAKRFVSNFLVKEKDLLKDNINKLKIIATEQQLETEINIDGFDFRFKIHGNVDRIDELNGVLRIIDYKTGKVIKQNLKASNFDNLKEEKYHKAVQVLMYAFLFSQNNNYDFSKPLHAGVFSFKNLNEGFLAVNFASGRNTENTISQEKLDEFLEILKTYINEIYNLDIAFIEPADLRY
jgi:ATP-dependent helicase/nuclease subunit B